MRPTNVRATVGSSASGSSASPIVSVPPFLMSADDRAGAGGRDRGGERGDARRDERERCEPPE